jgi:diacylglycerol kinase (ATP)
MEKHNRAFLSGRLKSFGYALQGLVSVFRTEHNMRLHLLATCVVTGLCIWLPVSTGEITTLVLAMGFVWVAEVFNTVIEKMMDFISPGTDDRVRRIKDMSAAAVLLAAITALITGCFVFIPKI